MSLPLRLPSRLACLLALSLAACATRRPDAPEVGLGSAGVVVEAAGPWNSQEGLQPVRFELAEGLEPAWREAPFARAALALAAEAPLDGPVLIQVLELEGVWGMAWWDEQMGSYRIQLDISIPGPGADWAIDTLIHEWAHCLVVGACKEDSHGPIWGVAQARCYRAAVDPGP